MYIIHIIICILYINNMHNIYLYIFYTIYNLIYLYIIYFLEVDLKMRRFVGEVKSNKITLDFSDQKMKEI